HQQVNVIAAEELRLAMEVRDAMFTAYKAGGRRLIEVLDAERNYREMYSLFITKRADYWRALYIYNSAVGINSANDLR
ncbi:MAG: hypothetical protein FWE89_01510, partial [Syntrophaceae bacterium]|nr:hypothetical protein [Syntrophaceae bacterium]